MQWFRWHPATRRHEPERRFGSRAVIGLRSMRDLAALRARFRFKLVQPIPALRAAVVSVNRAELRRLLAVAPGERRIRYVSPDSAKRHVLELPDDPLVRTIDPLSGRPYEWQFAAANVHRALDFTSGDARVLVGVIDTGISPVPDLAGKIDGLWSVAPDGTVTADPLSVGNDDVGHGTAVASLIAANVGDGFGMAGFGGATHVIGIHAGYLGFFHDTEIARALIKLDELGVRIANMSLGGPSPSEPILIDAIHKAAADGMLIIAAAGNDHGQVAWPAAALQPRDGTRGFGLAVGASNSDGSLAEFSNSGKHLSLLAPGASEGDTCFTGVLVALVPAGDHEPSYCHPAWNGSGGADYTYLAGTSFAAPEVAGIAALIWAARPELRNYQVADIIKHTAHRDPDTGWLPGVGCGRLDAGAALALATSRTTAEWAVPTPDGDASACSIDGDQTPTWPNKAHQTIDFKPLPNRRLRDPDLPLHASATSRLPVSFNADGRCVIHNNAAHPTGPGTCTITATQPGNEHFNPARPLSRSFSIKASRSRALRRT
jgi:subtilisin family serine protease